MKNLCILSQFCVCVNHVELEGLCFLNVFHHLYLLHFFFLFFCRIFWAMKRGIWFSSVCTNCLSTLQWMGVFFTTYSQQSLDLLILAILTEINRNLKVFIFAIPWWLRVWNTSLCIYLPFEFLFDNALDLYPFLSSLYFLGI